MSEIREWEREESQKLEREGRRGMKLEKGLFSFFL